MFNRSILFFDSGIGGLTVLHEARIKMPDYSFIYVADDQAFPYGDWVEDALIEHSLKLFDKLLNIYNPILSVIACNTASTLILDALRYKYKDHLFVGTVPAIKPAAEQTATGLISVLATKGTVKRAYTQDLIASYAQKCQVNLVGSCHLAQYAEDYLQGLKLNDQKIALELAPCFKEDGQKRTDIVVLACTHYPFLVNQFRKFAPWPVDWLNPAEAIAQQAQSLLKSKFGLDQGFEMIDRVEDSFLKQNRDQAFFTSNQVSHLKKRILQGFGLNLREFT